MTLRQKTARFFLKCLGWKVLDLAPKYKKCVLVIAPHTSNWDFFYGKLGGDALQRNGKFLIKDDWFFFPMNLFFKAVGGIPVNRKNKNAHMTDVISDMLKGMDDLCIAITPEGTRKPVSHWKRGFYYIAKKANVPIILAKLDYGKKLITIGQVIFPGEDEEADMLAIKNYYRGVRGKIPKNFMLDE